jgi:lipopolysaccharide biosynthesis glycosyltransferase
MLSNEISVLFSSDEKYIRYCATTITSILLNASQPGNIHFYILSPDCSKNSKERLEKLCFLFDAQLTILPIDLNRFKSLPSIEHLSLNTYSRLYAPELCSNIKRLLYLDADIVVLGDIVKLFNLDLAGKPLGAVPHVQFPYEKIFQKKFDVAVDSHFNGGVMLMDCDLWRKNSYSDLVIQWASNHAKHLTFADQDALNGVFAGQYCHLPGVWNVEARLFQEKLLGLPQTEEIIDRISSPMLIHYTGGDKPWASKKYVPKRELYLKYSTCLAEIVEWPRDKEPDRCSLLYFLSFIYSCLYFRAVSYTSSLLSKR